MLPLRHVTGLAVLDIVVVTVLPLQVGHLLGQSADGLALRIECMREEGMAGGAEIGDLAAELAA